MRIIKQTRQFRRDLVRETRGQYRAVLETALLPVVDLLAHDTPLAPHHRDHALVGNWRAHRDCHIKPDLVLI